MRSIDAKIRQHNQMVAQVTPEEISAYLTQIMLTKQGDGDDDSRYHIHIRCLREKLINFRLDAPLNEFYITKQGRKYLRDYNINLTMSSI